MRNSLSAAKISALLVLLLAASPRAQAIQDGSAAGFTNTSSTTPGAAYVGEVNGASATYLGNDYVLTAAHVGAGDFTLDGTTYSLVAGSAQTLTTTDAIVNGTVVPLSTADLTVFKILGDSKLPTLSLTLASAEPTPNVSSVVMIGYGGGHGETFGVNTVTSVHDQVDLNDPTPTYVSYDFTTANGTFPNFTNSAQVVPGDSGGGDFILNSATGVYELAGINEVYSQDSNGTDTSSGFVALGDGYTQQILAITGAPEPSVALLLAASGLALAVLSRRFGFC